MERRERKEGARDFPQIFIEKLHHIQMLLRCEGGGGGGVLGVEAKR